MEEKKKKKQFLEKPLYSGGSKALREFLKAHLQYPQDAMDQRIEGVVTIGYQVNDDGVVENPVVIKSLSPSCDAEALRLVQMLQYEKARNRGVRLKVNCKVNINFHLAPTPTPSTITYHMVSSGDKAKKKPAPQSGNNIGYTITIEY